MFLWGGGGGLLSFEVRLLVVAQALVRLFETSSVLYIHIDMTTLVRLRGRGTILRAHGFNLRSIIRGIL